MKAPKWAAYFCFILSHLQVIAIIIKSVYLALPDNTPSVSPVIHTLLKFFIVGDWINYDKATPLFVGTSIITLYILKMLILMGYIYFSLAQKWRIPSFIQYYWSTLHSLHPILIFFWIHTYCLGIIKYPQQYVVTHEIKVPLRAMAFFSTVISCLLAFLLSTISLTFKTKDVLSSKTSMLEMKNVIFKILIPSLWRVAENNRELQTFTLILILVNAISHDWIFFKNLPYYRVNVLIMSSILQAIQTSLALVCFIVKLVESGGANIGVFTFQLVWILLLPIAIKSYYIFTWKILLYIFQCELKNEKNVSYLIHKRFVLLYFMKSRRIIHEGIYQLKDADLMYQAKLTKYVQASGLSFKELDRNKKSLLRSLKATYLEILNMHRKSPLAQINLAHFYSKFESLYLVSNNLLEDAISRCPGYYAEISLNMLRFELQKKLMVQFSHLAGEEQKSEGLNVYNYISNQELLEKVKESIEKQAEMQIGFWQEFLASKPHMLNLMNIALKIRNQKQIVKKQWNNLSKVRAKSFLSPLIVYGKYSSLINNNPHEGEKLLKRSEEETKRMNRFFKADELSNQTIFSDKTVQITMSGLRSKLGKIIGCSANIVNFYGWQANEMGGRPITFLMPPFYRQRHDNFLLDHFNTGKTKTLNNTEIYPVKRSNGYIHPTWIHVKVSPVMEKGIFYVGLLRPSKSNQRMVLVRRDGKIDDMSFGFARDMHLEGKEGHIECDIFTLCPQFQRVNEAFNMIAEQAIEKDAAAPSSNHLLHTQVTRKRIQETERNIGEADLTSQRPFISTRKRFATLDKLRDGAHEETPTTLQEATITDVQKIYENFMAGNSALTFYPIKQAEPITYSVKITNNIHDNEVIKFILLEKISGEESVDENRMSDTESSDHEALFPSLKMVAENELVVQKKKIPQALLSPSRFGPSTSPSLFDSEGGEFLLMSTSPKIKSEVKSDEQANDGTNLSIFDEIQSNDSLARRAVFRSIREENDHSLFSKRETKDPTVKLPEAYNKKAKSQFFEIQAFKSKQFQRKLKRRQEDVLVNIDRKESSMASSTYLYRGKKAEQLMIQALQTEPTKKSAKIFTFLLGFFFISVISLLGAQTTNLSSGIKEVQNQTPVISAAFFRQYNMISASTQVRALKGILDGYVLLYDWQTDNGLFMTYLQEYLSDLLKYNTQFYESLSNLPLEMQSRFSEKNVAFYDYDEDDGEKTLYSKESFSDSLGMMVERFIRCLYIELPDEWEPGIDTLNHGFIINNALNDLLIQSQSQIDQLTDYFDESTNSTTLKAGLIMGGVLLACLIFVIVAVHYMCLLASEARIFMTMIFRMRPQDCEAAQLTLQNFKAWLRTDLKDQDLPVTKILKRHDARNINSTRFRSASLSSLYGSQRIAFLKLLQILCLFICWSVVYFVMTSSFIGNIQDSKKRMEASLQALNNQTLFVAEIVSLPLSNATATIKNELLLPSIDVSLQYLEEISVFVDWFHDRKGELTPLQQEVLFGFDCEDFEPYLATNYLDYIYAYDSCFVVAKGTDKIGLVDLNSQFYDVGIYILALYEGSSKTLEELGYIFAIGVSMANDVVNSAEGFLKLLYEATYESFEYDVDSIKRRSLILTIVIVIVTIVAIVITWYFAIIKIFKAQKIDWYILQIIPLELIRSNKHLQQYLLKRSNGMLDGVKSSLS